MQQAGDISDLKHQDSVKLTPFNITWKVDFSYINNKTGEREYAEAKGMETDRYRIIKQLWSEIGPGILHVWKGDYSRSFLRCKVTEKIVPTRMIVHKCQSCGQPRLW